MDMRISDSANSIEQSHVHSMIKMSHSFAALIESVFLD
jgi:hypothetical protein